MSTRPVCNVTTTLSPIKLMNVNSPKPNMPPAKAYDPPSPPSAKDLGPPPPGYGRYADFDRGLGGGPSGQGGLGNSLTGPPRRNLDEVLCFKVSLANYQETCRFKLYYYYSVVKRDTMPIIVETVTFQVIEEGVKESRGLENESVDTRSSFPRNLSKARIFSKLVFHCSVYTRERTRMTS